jgi:hypothetical protein
MPRITDKFSVLSQDQFAEAGWLDEWRADPIFARSLRKTPGVGRIRNSLPPLQSPASSLKPPKLTS